MKKIAIAALLFLAACGGTKTIYVVNTDAPDTSAPKRASTTDAPIAVAPSSGFSAAEEMFLFAIESNYGTIYMDKRELIETGRMTCTALRNGATAYDIYDAILGVGEQEFIIVVVASAISNFCPEQTWKFQ